VRAAIGIDVGGTKLLACAVDDSGRVLSEAYEASPQNRGLLIDALESVTLAALAELPDDSVEIAGVGLGLPGLVDRAGVLHETANLHAIDHTTIGAELEPRVLAACESKLHVLGAPSVIAENDATCAAAGELAFGAARGVDDAVVITLGTGIGGGLIADGRIVFGGQGFAGEIGHMVVVAAGQPCGCGGRGCWEQYASGSAIARFAHEAIAAGGLARVVDVAGGNSESVRAEHVVSAARAGDPESLMLLDTAARYLAIGLSNLAEILDPTVFVISGGLSEADDVFVAPAIAHFAHERRGSGPRAVEVRRANLGSRAGAIGAGALALGLLQ
jgi:glucokinase